MRVTSLVAALVFATFTADAAHAFRTRTCEALGATAPMKVDGTSLTVRTSMVSFPSGVWRDSMINSVNQFNRTRAVSTTPASMNSAAWD